MLSTLERVPHELKDRPQWVNWRQDEARKVPLNPITLKNAGVTWPNTWAEFTQAHQTAAERGLGLGYVLTEADGYTCVDLDGCVENDGSVDARTRAILDLLTGWVELSPSETGLHIWVRNQEPVNRRTKGIEIYSSSRWMSVTGRSNPRVLREIPERTAEVAELVKTYFPEEKREFIPSRIELDDEDIWERLFASKSGSFFQSLFNGDTSVCFNDHSRAVILLANQLALLTDLDAGRVKRLLYQTDLVNEKWESKRGNFTWIDHQIQDAIGYVAGWRK